MSTEMRVRDAARLFWAHRCNPILAGLTLATGGAALWWAGPAQAPVWALWAALGVAMWPGLEYVTHRFILHAKPLPWGWALRMQRRLHYDHHQDPKDTELLFAPIWFTVPATLVLAGLYGALLGDPARAGGLLFGNLAAMLAYEWVHFMAHQPYVPKSEHFKRLKKLHAWHHFKNERYWFGVTVSALDRVGGTHPDFETVAASPTVRVIHGDVVPPA